MWLNEPHIRSPIRSLTVHSVVLCLQIQHQHRTEIQTYRGERDGCERSQLSTEEDLIRLTVSVIVTKILQLKITSGSD